MVLLSLMAALGTTDLRSKNNREKIRQICCCDITCSRKTLTPLPPPTPLQIYTHKLELRSILISDKLVH